MDINLLGFMPALLPVALSPGASFTLVMSGALAGGHKGLFRTLAGTALGIYTHAVLIGFGITSVKLARAQQASAALGYRQTVLTALQDVENALVSYRSDQQQVEGLDDTVDALQNAFKLASDSYGQGLSTFIEALDAQRQLAQAQQQAEQARVQSSLDLVALYKALGGGWEAYQNVDLPQYSVFGPAENP